MPPPPRTHKEAPPASATPSSALSISEKIDWIRLIRSENVGPVTFRRLLDRFGRADRALEALPELARQGGRKSPMRVCALAEAAREVEALDRLGARLIAIGEPAYPPPLAQIEDAPPLISVLGHPEILLRSTIGVVGARNASLGGRRFARTVAADLGRAGLAVVSGLARGIDTAAHEGALETGTTAVLAGGVDSVYPRENDSLWKAIAQRGAVVSEMPPGTIAKARDFPRRNRLVSGLSLGIVVIEAGARSGSLITARMALEQGREVFAVPGSPLDPRSQGANDLIRQGAVLTESAQDVLNILSGSFPAPLGEPQAIGFEEPFDGFPDSPEVERARSIVQENLSPTPVMVDEILRSCQLSPPVVSLVLLELELAGRLERHPGNRVSLILKA